MLKHVSVTRHHLVMAAQNRPPKPTSFPGWTPFFREMLSDFLPIPKRVMGEAQGMDLSTKLTVLVSTEITSLVGRGECNAACLPADAVIIGFGDIGEPIVSVIAQSDLADTVYDDLVVLAIGRPACIRLFGLMPRLSGRWYLPADLRGLGRKLVAVEGEGEVADMLRAARSMELLCGLFAALVAKKMVEVRGATTLTEQDIGRVAKAHEMVTENWQERLTVSSVAQRCGLNKAKLTRGFRELYSCTIPEALTERRLERARELLAQSDLPVSSIAYRCGYANNASFTRAFVRRFGATPTEIRRRESDAVHVCAMLAHA